jgi:hypothetical protein
MLPLPLTVARLHQPTPNRIALIVEQTGETSHLFSVKRRKDINTRHYVSYGLRILRKSRKRFEPCLATRTMPEMTNYLIIQKFRLMGCNDFVIASNTLHSVHEHGTSFHRSQQACFGSLNDEDLPRGHGDYVTASGTTITLA